MAQTILGAARSGLFYFGYIVLTAWFGITAIIFLSWTPYRVRQLYLAQWNHCVLWWLRLSCGVRFQVQGREHIPQQPVVVLSKHSSQWETFFLPLLFPPLATIVKQELLKIPGFGWGLKLLKPIAINRDNPRQALRQMQDQGKSRLQSGISVLVFPEGSRTGDSDAPPKYARGGASLAIASNAMVIPVAHNAASCWPPHRFIKYPGVVTLAIGPALETTGKNARELTEQARQWIEEKTAELM